MRWLDSITDPVDVNLNKPWATVEDRGAWCAAVHGVTKSHDLVTEQQQQSMTQSNSCEKKLVLSIKIFNIQFCSKILLLKSYKTKIQIAEIYT